jgi:hypothetical protein
MQNAQRELLPKMTKGTMRSNEPTQENSRFRKSRGSAVENSMKGSVTIGLDWCGEDTVGLRDDGSGSRCGHGDRWRDHACRRSTYKLLLASAGIETLVISQDREIRPGRVDASG